MGNWQRTQTTGAGVGLVDRITALQEPSPEPGSATSPTQADMMAHLATYTLPPVPAFPSFVSRKVLKVQVKADPILEILTLPNHLNGA